MSPVDQTTLEKLMNAGGRMILEDRSCKRCGYDLKGLITGGNCPECGKVIKYGRPAREQPFATMPKGWLIGLLIGSALLLAGAMASSLLPLSALVFDTADALGRLVGHVLAPLRSYGRRTPASMDAMGFGVAVGVFALAWLAGTWLVTRPRPASACASEEYRPRAEWRLLRWTARGSAALGVGNAWLLGAWVASGSTLAVSAWFVLTAATLAPVLAYMAYLLLWIPDDRRAWGVRGAMVLLGATGILLAILPTPVGIFLRVFVLLLGGTFFASVLYVQWSALQIALACRGAMRHQKKLDARDQRLADRAEAAAAASAASASVHRLAPIPDANAELQRAVEQRHEEMEREVPQAPAGPKPGRDRVIPHSEETYGVEDE